MQTGDINLVHRITTSWCTYNARRMQLCTCAVFPHLTLLFSLKLHFLISEYILHFGKGYFNHGNFYSSLNKASSIRCFDYSKITVQIQLL